MGITVDGLDVGRGSGAGWTFASSNLTLTGTGPYVISGNNTTNIVKIVAAADCTVVASNLTVDVSSVSGGIAFDCGAHSVNLQLAGTTNRFLSGKDGAGIQVVSNAAGVAALTVTNRDDSAMLVAEGGAGGAGIGAGRSMTCGRLAFNGGRVSAVGGSYSAGVGGGYNGDGGAVTVSGGVLEAAGGKRGAGIGGGYGGAGGSLEVLGGNILAHGDSTQDIGFGYNGKVSGANCFLGGSILPASGLVAEAPSNGMVRVWCATITGFVPSELYSFDGCGAYNAKGLLADTNGCVYLWLPDGSYSLGGKGWEASVTVSGSNVTSRTSSVSTYSISYAGLGGATNSAVNPLSYTMTNETITFVAPASRRGWTFTGWSPASIPGGSYGNYTVTAAWQIVSYPISYNLGVGCAANAASNPSSYTVTNAFTFAEPVAKPGWAFTGWSPAGIAADTIGNFAVTANWSLITYPITYLNLNGAPNSSSNPAGYTVTNGIAFAGLGEYGGKVFTGWSRGSIALGSTGTVTTVASWAPLSGVRIGGRDAAYGRDAGWTYADSILTLTGGVDYVISGSNGLSAFSIIANADSTVVLSNLTLDVSSFDDEMPLDCNGHAVTLKLWNDAGQTNILRGGANCAGVSVADGAALAILSANAGGRLLAVGGDCAAGIGGGNEVAAGSIVIRGGCVTAQGGNLGAGIGGGGFAAGGRVSISGGTVLARGDSEADDIGNGVEGTGAATNLFTGGSIHLMNGAVNPGASDGMSLLHCVTVTGLTANASAALFALPGYSDSGMVADETGCVYLWLPDGNYHFGINDHEAGAAVAGADAVATLSAIQTYAIAYSNLQGAANAAANPASYAITNDVITFAEPMPLAGWTFTGWSPASIPAGSGGNVTVTANWQIVTYRLGYNLGIGCASNAAANPSSYTVTNALTFAEPTAKPGWAFAGWTPADFTVGTTGDLTVTANWAVITYPITYLNLNGAPNNPANPAGYTVTNGVTFADLGEYDGKVFTSWSKDSIAEGSIGTRTIVASWAALSGIRIGGRDAAYGRDLGWTYQDSVLTLTGGVDYVISGSNGLSAFSIIADADSAVVLSNLTLDVSFFDNVTAFDCNGHAVTMKLWNEVGRTNVLRSGANCAGILVTNGAALTILAANELGRLLAIGGDCAAGIGGGNEVAAGSIAIQSGCVTARGGNLGAGIGGGGFANGGPLTVRGGTVIVQGGEDAHDIGPGADGKAATANTILGGSIFLANGAISLAPSNGTEAVTCTTNEAATPEALETVLKDLAAWGYGTNGIVAQNGKVYAWLPAATATVASKTGGVAVPYAWIDRFFPAPSTTNYNLYANGTVASGYPIWECYLTGVTNAADRLTAEIALSNGVPVVTWTPDLGRERVYTVKGKESLSDASEWSSVTNAATHFYKVEVRMP